jgi:hypothetical protein
VGSQVVGPAIRAGVERLARRHRAELFAGVIVGWETQLGRDFDTGRALGYCALTNKGFSAAHPPADIDRERVAVVREFIELWAWSIAGSGIRSSKLYAHIAFLTRTVYERDGPAQAKSYLEATNYGPPEVAFETPLRPGFSTYPAAGLYPELHALLAARPHLPWASSEGTNVVPPGFAGEVSMETYLARMLNHGAALVNLFGWGLGREQGVGNPFRRQTEAPESIAAYRRFFAGAPLDEAPVPADYGLAAKVARIRELLPLWLAAGGSAAVVEPLLRELDACLNAGDPIAADAVAERILVIIGTVR